ncbi:MAG: hypothetical protein WBO97_15620, partial [Tepidiformaceae bacterium]
PPPIGPTEARTAWRTAQRRGSPVIASPARVHGEIATEIRLVRERAVARVTEMDLLVAALRDHIKDLQDERDWLRAEVARTNHARDLASATWLHRGQKPAHRS